MGGGLTKEQAIDLFFSKIYTKLYLKCTTESEFLGLVDLEGDFDEEFREIKNDDEVKEYYEKRLKENTDRFNEENERRNKIKEIKDKEDNEKKIQKDKDKIDELIKSNYDKACKEKNISDFQNYFKNNTDIKSLIEIREENKIHFENCLNLYSGKFFQKREEIEKKKSKISTHFETNYDEAKKNNYLYQFKNYYENKKGEISENLEKEDDEVKQHYNDELNKYIKKFNEFDEQRKTTKALEEMKKIDKYFTEECPKINEVINKSDLEKQLNRSGFYGNEHFNNKKQEKLNNYEEALNQYKWNITEFITNKYNDAFSSSEDE